MSFIHDNSNINNVDYVPYVAESKLSLLSNTIRELPHWVFTRKREQVFDADGSPSLDDHGQLVFKYVPSNGFINVFIPAVADGSELHKTNVSASGKAQYYDVVTKFEQFSTSVPISQLIRLDDIPRQIENIKRYETSIRNLAYAGYLRNVLEQGLDKVDIRFYKVKDMLRDLDKAGIPFLHKADWLDEQNGVFKVNKYTYTCLAFRGNQEVF